MAFSTPSVPSQPQVAASLADAAAVPAPAIPTPTINPPILTHGELVADRLKTELTVQRLNIIHKHLWLAGRGGNIRPLHRQQLIKREIVITESADLHLVWHKSRIFIKPLPLFLLDHTFFQENLCSTVVPDGETSTLHASACGLLRSYTSLIVHASDFNIAMTAGLLPPDLKWETWSQFAIDVRTRIKDDNVNIRYHFGELRATRLNLIYYIQMRDGRGYHYVHTRYASLFRDNFGWLLVVFLYATVVLTAMQTAMTSDQGGVDKLLQKVSYWFSLGSLLAVVGMLGLMFLIFLGSFVDNIFATQRHKKKKR